MDFKELIITTLSEEENIILEDEKMINEGIVFPLTPFIAFSALKKKVFENFNKEKKFKKISSVEKIRSKKRELKTDLLVAKEKVRANLGLASGLKETATVYRLTKEQMNVMSDIYNKYGKDLVKEINYFRVNVLAPYQLIKRIIKKSKAVTSSDVTGMTKEEFRANLESGRKKIVKAGTFFEKSKSVENKVRDTEDEIRTLEQEKAKLETGKDLSSSILEKVYASFKVGEKDFGNYTLVDLKNAYDEYSKNLKLLKSYNRVEKSKLEPSEILNLVKRNYELTEKGPQKKVVAKEEPEKTETKEEDKEPKEQMSFSLAFGKYMLRRSIRDNLKRETGSEIYRKVYISIINDMIKSLKEKKAELMKYYVNLKKTIDLTPKEKMIWHKMPGNTTNFSGKLEDYYQKYKEEDFKEPEYIERPEELQRAEQDIENEIKRFERKLAEIVEPEDLAKLKKYRLINNLITLSELKDPASLFRTADELRELQNQKIAATHFVDEEEFLNKIKEVTNTAFETKEELDKAKSELRAVAQTLRRQNDLPIIQNNAEAFRVALGRKNLEGKAEPEKKEEENREEVNIDTVKQIVNMIISRQYSSKEEVENDEKRLNEVTEEFKKQDENAISKLNEIDEDIKKAKKKISFAKETV